MAVVILEGIDRVGKTTISERLQGMGFKTLKDESVHEIGVNVDASDYANGGIHGITMCLALFSKLGVDLVVDRFHLTEWVYGIAERGYAPLYTWKVDKLLSDAGVKLILLQPESVAAATARSAIKRVASGKVPVDLSLHQSLMEFAYKRSMMGKSVVDFDTPTESLERLVW